jgi:hypothetical protein
VKSYFARAAVTLTAVAMLGGVGLTAASASVPHAKPNATVPCALCVNVFNQGQGNHYILSTAGHYGNPVRIKHASNSSVSEDFIAYSPGTLGQFIASGKISSGSYVANKYPHSDPVFEAQYSPGGFDSGLCIAVKGTAHNGEGVTLRDCGAAARSLWVGDISNAQPDGRSLLGADVPLVNASDNSFSRPLVLTFNGVGSQLSVTEQQRNNGVVVDTQEWGLTNVV